jgi:hypothetical protein
MNWKSRSHLIIYFIDLRPQPQAICFEKVVPVRWFPAYICECMIERETSLDFRCNRDNSGDSVILRNQTKWYKFASLKRSMREVFLQLLEIYLIVRLAGKLELLISRTIETYRLFPSVSQIRNNRRGVPKLKKQHNFHTRFTRSYNSASWYCYKITLF